MMEIPVQDKPIIQDFTYWAFISYSHDDRKWGEWIHHALETYRVPKRLVGLQSPTGPVPARLLPVFRDRDELAATSTLTEKIEHALQASRTLIVVCSPRSVASPWVNAEIQAFHRLGRHNRVLALIIDGEPGASEGKPGFEPDQECFPLALRYRSDTAAELASIRGQLVAADVRPGKDGKANARLKLVAGVLGLNLDDLRQREHQRRQRRMMLTSAISLVLAGLMAVLAGVAFHARNDARRSQREAELRLADSLVAQAATLSGQARWGAVRELLTQAHEAYLRLGASPLAARIGYLSVAQASPDCLIVCLRQACVGKLKTTSRRSGLGDAS